MKMYRKDEGFTLVELMVVVLIIGILVAIAVPVFLNASANAQAKSCQANQRTVVGAISTFNATYPAAEIKVDAAGEQLGVAGSKTLPLFKTTGSGTTATNPVIKSVPVCPAVAGGYFVDTNLTITGDAGTNADWGTGIPAARAAHKLGS